MTFHLHLAYRGNELRMVRTCFRDDTTPPDQWTIELFETRENWKLKMLQSHGHAFLNWKDPQRGLVVLLLKAFGEQGLKFEFTGTESLLAWRLFDVVRRPETTKKQSTWLQLIFGLGKENDAEKRKSQLNQSWFVRSGSSGTDCSVWLGPKWEHVTFKVFVEEDKGVPKLIPQRQYAIYAEQVESQSLEILTTSEVICTLKVAVWDKAERCYKSITGPVQEGDKLKVKVSLNQKSHILVAWVDQYGKPYEIHPLTNNGWDSGYQADPLELLSIPNVPDDMPGNLLTEGPPGLETIVVMARRERPEHLLLKRLTNALRLPDTRGWQTLASSPVASQLRTLLTQKPASKKTFSTVRTPKFVSVSSKILKLHQSLAARLKNDFDDVAICTFANSGPGKR